MIRHPLLLVSPSQFPTLSDTTRKTHPPDKALVPEQATKDDQVRLHVLQPGFFHAGHHDLGYTPFKGDRSLFGGDEPVGGFVVYHADPAVIVVHSGIGESKNSGGGREKDGESAFAIPPADSMSPPEEGL
jgi:hypothetical protein